MNLNQPKGTVLYAGGFELADKNAAAHRVLSIGKMLKKMNYEVNVIKLRGSKFLSIYKDASTSHEIV